MKLSSQQRTFFETFGYLGFPGLFADEADAITAEFERLWAEHGGGHHGQAHDYQQRSALVPFIDQSEYLSALLDDPRIDDVASELVGDDYNYAGSDGNFYVGNSRWHSDGYARSKYRNIKFAFYLDPVGRDSGCLRVIPGSHHRGDDYAEGLQDIMSSQRAWTMADRVGVSGQEMPAVALETKPGRRADVQPGPQARILRRRNPPAHVHHQRVRALCRGGLGRAASGHRARARFWIERAYGEAMIRTAGPKRMRHLEQRLANDDHLPELVRRARQEMSEPSRG